MPGFNMIMGNTATDLSNIFIFSQLPSQGMPTMFRYSRLEYCAFVQHCCSKVTIVYIDYNLLDNRVHYTKMKFSIKDFISKYNQIRRKLRIWPHLLKKSLMKNFIFCVVILVFFVIDSLKPSLVTVSDKLRTSSFLVASLLVLSSLLCRDKQIRIRSCLKSLSRGFLVYNAIF